MRKLYEFIRDTWKYLNENIIKALLLKFKLIK